MEIEGLSFEYSSEQKYLRPKHSNLNDYITFVA